MKGGSKKGEKRGKSSEGENRRQLSGSERF